MFKKTVAILGLISALFVSSTRTADPPGSQEKQKNAIAATLMLPLNIVGQSADPPKKDEKWNGSASCLVECPNGRCKPVVVTCNGALSYEDARRKLESSIQAEVRREGGQIKGNITVTIKKTL
jgi:hypothetical protein